MAADLMVYDTEKKTFLTDSLMAGGERYMKHSSFVTPDRKTHCYFCRANAYKEDAAGQYPGMTCAG
ncbi:hypothetical protein NXY49_00075 [Bacteroides fragilis]|nr:hypothetical protein [Bacteroides fragilis]